MTGKRSGKPHLYHDGMVVALSVIGLTGLTVVVLSTSSPVVMAAVLTALAAVLATVPPIIKALKSGGR